MKNILKTVITGFIFLISNKTYSQLDTLNYLKQFEINKAQYIGQPFSKLLNDMTQIQPKTVWFDYNIKNKNIVERSRFKFGEMDHSFKNVITLNIAWEQGIPYSEVEFYENKNDFYFTNDERSFYGNKIIKDIKVYR